MPTERITWQDVLLMPEDGNRYEAIGGVLYVTPAPTLRHQWISANLHIALVRLLVEPGLGYVFFAPVGVEFPTTEEGVQPDLVFISKERGDIMVKEGIRGAPDLVVEIASPGTTKRDRTVKRDLYQRHGVAQYWVVDPESESVEVWDFGAGATKPRVYLEEVPVRFEAKSPGVISLSEIFPPDL